jgi:hypothetical protein
MSLRLFHILFVIVCLGLCLFVAIWGIREYAASRDARGLALGIVFIVCGIGLAEYGRRAYHKLKELP